MDIKAVFSKLKQKATSAQGRSVVTFLIFLLVSTIFWFMMTLNETIQRDYRLNVEITDMPNGVIFISRPPEYIDVSVKDKGRALIKYDWGNPPTIKIKYGDFIKKSDSRIVINQEMLSNSIRNSFGSGCEILSIRPDSINLMTTSRPGDRLPIFFDISANTEPQFISYGNLQCKFDSVTVYSLNGIPSTMLSIRTEPVSLRNLTDTTTVNVKLISPAGMRVEPSEVSVTIPIEPLVAKKRIVPVTAVNVPKNVTIHTFPANIELNYLVPLSMFKNDAVTPAAIIDYNNIDFNATTAHVTVTQLPDYYHNCDPTPAEVEYLVEHTVSGVQRHTDDKKSDN